MAMDFLLGKTLSTIPYLNSDSQKSGSQKEAPSRVLVNASGFGGNCVTLLLEKQVE